MSSIFLNGETREIAEAITIETLLAELRLVSGACAVVVNETIVPRSTYGATLLNDADRVEIVKAIGGG